MVRLRRFLAISLLVAILSVSGSGCKNKTDPELLHLTIVHTNDVEGAVDPCECTVSPSGGARRSSTAIKNLRGEYPDLLLLDSGDALFGSDVADATSGLAQIAVMNALKYDAAGLGDRDFLYGLGVLQNALKEANFPFLSANIKWSEDGHDFTQVSTIIERGSNRIAIFALTSPEVIKVWSADPEMSRKLTFRDPVEVAREIVPELRKQADAVILLSHLGSTLDRQLASQVPGISAIIGGHSRELINPPEILENGIPVVQMGYDGDPLGVLSIEVNGDKETIVTSASKIRLSSDIPSDPEMSALVDHYKALAVFSGDLPFELGLSTEFPLDVRKASREVKTAYLVALAFPELLEQAAFPGNDADRESQSLLDCFLVMNQDSRSGVSFETTAIDEPACIEQALDILDTAPVIVNSDPVMPYYLIEPGDNH